MENEMNFIGDKVQIGTLSRGYRFRDISGRICTFDRWYKDGDNAVIASIEGGASDLYAACALVEIVEFPFCAAQEASCKR